MQPQFTRTQLTIFLSMMMAIDLIMIAVIVGTLASPRLSAVVVAAGIVFPALFFWVLIPVIAGCMGWFGIRRRFPAVGNPVFRGDAPMISPGFNRSWMGLNNVVEAYTDDDHLHMRVWAPFGGWRMPVSIPWGAVPEITPFKKDRAILHIDGGPRLFVPLRLVRNEMALRASMREAQGAP
jgi:hypothetical protein